MVLEGSPKLIPIYGHRFIPDSPSEWGNPIFSISQSDIIRYGGSLADYLRWEFNVACLGMEEVIDGLTFGMTWFFGMKQNEHEHPRITGRNSQHCTITFT